MKLIALLTVVLLGPALLFAQDDAPRPPDHVEIPNAQPAAPGDFGAGMKPVMWIGVKACGQYVIWLVFDDHIAVVDQQHHPKDMAEFMHALEHSKIPSDEREIECTSAAL